MEDDKRVLTLQDVPEGHWVVLTSDDRVVAHHRDLRTAIEMGEKSGEENLEIIRAINLGMHFCGCRPLTL